MNILNERVKHTTFGLGVITKVKDEKIWVQFQDGIGIKAFLYPESFEKFLKAMNPTIENNVLEELHRKQEQLRLEAERKEKEHEAAKLEEEKRKLELAKKKKATRSKKKKS